MTIDMKRWVLVLGGLALACAEASVDQGAAGSGTTGGIGGATGGATGSMGKVDFKVPGVDIPVVPCPNALCSDFPADPIIEMGTPAGAAAMFSGSASGAGPCIVEPEDGTLFPYNWLRPRIKWKGTTGIHKITISSQRQDKELVAYTSGDSWTMPKEIWRNLAGHVQDLSDIVVKVRAAGGGESQVKFNIAPVDASGSMVFWAAKPSEVGKDPALASAVEDSELRGFTVGDESTATALKISDVKQESREQSWQKTRRVRCIGCHTATPDNAFVAFTDHWPWSSAIAGVKPGNTGDELPGVTEGGKLALNMPWGGMLTFAKAHWTPGKRLAVVGSSLQNPMAPWSTDNKAVARLLWLNLDSPLPMMVDGQPFPALGVNFGEIVRQGDPRGAACPNWSHDGQRIVYSSTMGGNQDGRLEKGATDLYMVPFGDGMGGMATPVAGAADPQFEEYYPAFSPDDNLIVYNRVPSGQRMYANPNAELFVVSSKAGASVRLKANDPPACSGKKSPGINNHWAKWSPAVKTAGGRIYYWVIFSSNRTDIPPVRSMYIQNSEPIQVSQLFVTAVVQELEGQIRTFPAIYLWNQPTSTLNTTPAWETLEIPTVVE